MLLVILLVLLISVVCVLLLKWNELKYNKKGVPPGTMGWPLLGETTEFLKYGPEFMKKQRAKYGSVFKTHILGSPTVVVMDADLNKFVLMNENKGFVPGYPESMTKILGKWNIASVSGSLHKTMRGAMLSLINPNAVKQSLLTDIDGFMKSYLTNMGGKTIDIQDKTKDMALLLALKQVAGLDPAGPRTQTLVTEFHKLTDGTLSLPIDLPGTGYRQAFQARKKIIELLSEIMEERKVSNRIYNDMLGAVIRSDDEHEKVKYELTDEQILDMMIAIIYAGYETVSTTSMMALKFLHDNPKALNQLKEEHEAVRRNKAEGEGLKGDDYKLMTFTQAVIYETLRLATVVHGVLRRTTEDVEFKGFMIPKGWKLYIYMREINHDSKIYYDSLAFNPWRWLERNSEAQTNFMMFGGGMRLCPGRELGLVEISVFLHHMISMYRWEEVEGQTIMKFPRVFAPKGFRFRFFEHP